jgi:hypothetical protein
MPPTQAMPPGDRRRQPEALRRRAVHARSIRHHAQSRACAGGARTWRLPPPGLSVMEKILGQKNQRGAGATRAILAVRKLGPPRAVGGVVRANSALYRGEPWQGRATRGGIHRVCARRSGGVRLSRIVGHGVPDPRGPLWAGVSPCGPVSPTPEPTKRCLKGGVFVKACRIVGHGVPDPRGCRSRSARPTGADLHRAAAEVERARVVGIRLLRP